MSDFTKQGAGATEHDASVATESLWELEVLADEHVDTETSPGEQDAEAAKETASYGIFARPLGVLSPSTNRSKLFRFPPYSVSTCSIRDLNVTLLDTGVWGFRLDLFTTKTKTFRIQFSFRNANDTEFLLSHESLWRVTRTNVWMRWEPTFNANESLRRHFDEIVRLLQRSRA